MQKYLSRRRSQSNGGGDGADYGASRAAASDIHRFDRQSVAQIAGGQYAHGTAHRHIQQSQKLRSISRSSQRLYYKGGAKSAY